MVATKGRGWVLAPSLVALIQQADALAPNRSRIADGSIGDTAHSTRVSDHNPSGGFVHAVDITHNPIMFDAYAFAAQIAARADRRVNYVISNGRIWKSKTGRWETYTGPSKHDHHTHVSIFHDNAARNDTGPWFPSPPGDDMPLDATDLQKVKDLVEGVVKDLVPKILKTEGVQAKLDALLKKP